MDSNASTALSSTSSQSHLRIYQESHRVSSTIHGTPDGGQAISVYSGVRTKQGLADATKNLVNAFPGWTVEQTAILKDRFAENGFTDQRMIDAVNHVIDTYEGYGRIPNIANFIQYDQRVKILTYAEITKLQYDGSISWDDYQPIDVGLDKPRWAKIEDVLKYQIKMWQHP